MSSSFKDHVLSEAEMTWLKAVYEDSQFDPKMAKVRLREKLPKGFDPKKIDARFLLNGKILTVLGIWKVDPESPELKNLERVILCIRDLILSECGIETITSELLSTKLGIQEPDVQKALGYLTTLGGFYSGASGRTGSTGCWRIELTGDNIYDPYLAFESLESLMQEYYEDRAQQSDASEVPLLSVPGAGVLTQGLSPSGGWGSRRNYSLLGGGDGGPDSRNYREEKRRFRGRECWGLSKHREPLNRTRRSVWE